MILNVFLLGILIMAYYMVSAKRLPAMVNAFSAQSLFLSLSTLFCAIAAKNSELYVIAGMLFVLKVILIPHFLRRIIREIKVEESVGFFVNPVLSLFCAGFLTYLSYLFSSKVIFINDKAQNISFTVSFAVLLIGFFIMIFRQKALTQVIGFLVMENGLFLAAAAVSGGMPFFVEIAVFMDVFISVIILGVFVFRINKLFTHIDVSKLNALKR